MLEGCIRALRRRIRPERIPAVVSPALHLASGEGALEESALGCEGRENQLR